jgi:hypothetical protein
MLIYGISALVTSSSHEAFFLSFCLPLLRTIYFYKQHTTEYFSKTTVMDKAWHMCSLITPHLVVSDLARVGSSHPILQLALQQELAAGTKLHAHALLRGICEVAAEVWRGSYFSHEPSSELDRLSSAASWLMATSGYSAMLDGAIPENQVPIMSLLEVSDVPLGLAETLVSAGLRPSPPQLLAAVRNLTRGVTVWVRACHTQGVPTGLSGHLDLVCRQKLPEVRKGWITVLAFWLANV